MIFIPSAATNEALEMELLPDFIKMPYFNRSRIYLMLGGGMQATGNKWDSLLRAGAGIEMPITRDSNIMYFVDGHWNVVGIATNTNADPYVTARTGFRIPF